MVATRASLCCRWQALQAGCRALAQKGCCAPAAKTVPTKAAVPARPVTGLIVHVPQAASAQRQSPLVDVEKRGSPVC